MFDAVGRFRLVKQLLSFILKQKRIQLVLPAYPCKSPNHITKVLGELPDLGEELSLIRLNEFAKQVLIFFHRFFVG
jgi:pyoverdine/dityrosine biosynthesis protein Dit1